MFRLGPSLAVRMPRRQLSAGLIENEQRWLPTLAPKLPISIPSPVHIGLPGRAYPWRWSIARWLSGSPADIDPPNTSQAIPLATFLRALHVPAPDDAPANPFRAVPIRQRADEANRMKRLRKKTSLITRSIEQAWNEGLDAAPGDERCWLHGDLHARNVLVRDGIITGIIDWGDISAGDPAVDLASIWMLLADSDARQAALDHYSASAAIIARSKAWAVLFGLFLLDNGLIDNPSHAGIGAATLTRIAEDEARARAL